LSENRTGQRSSEESAPILEAETLRNSLAIGAAALPAKSEEHGSSLWKIFGGTLLSIAALVVLSLCQHFNSCLNDLRSDLGRLNDELRKDLGHASGDLRKDMNRLSESYGELIKKDDYNTRLHSVWESIKELQSLQAAVTALKERAALHDQQMREAGERKELVREIQLLRERLASLEGQQGTKPAVKPAVHNEN
jgi:heme exporter protein D